ncbi:F-box/kelch-repeat protein At3g23880-like [Pyrus x bretschneideri]|uniref:F-box/kelch-repeat protein At3g23880-like n=1 Tax=Pyrus x bretschneideri TaxID=225117 RepID=UPI00202E8537|nr:F-box/kelch-repeat protein At3g23880-like [Pyrus x bretschneideri]
MLDSLPQEITHDILFRLPTKSLIQCTSVCKPWRSMIINQSFIQYHLRRTISFNKRNDIHLLLVHSVSGNRTTSVRTHRHTTVMSDISQEVFSVHYDNQDFDKNSEIEFPSALKEELRNDILHVVGICNGLVCFAEDMHCYGNSFIIWNPFIRKSVTLPNPGITFPMYNSIPNYGGFAAAIDFGFDDMTADYKVVRVATPSNELRGPTMAEVYSLATGSWRSLGSVAPQCAIYGRKKHLFFNGALHWPAVRRTRDDHFILTFDVCSELFRKISMPKSVIWRSPLGLLLSVSGDRKSIALFVMDDTSKEYLDIWVMKEYGVRESWTKLISLGPQDPEKLLPRALCFRKNGEVLVMLLDGGMYLNFGTAITKGVFVSLDLVSKQLKNLEVCGPYCSVDSFEESHLLLDKTDAVSH